MVNSIFNFSGSVGDCILHNAAQTIGRFKVANTEFFKIPHTHINPLYPVHRAGKMAQLVGVKFLIKFAGRMNGVNYVGFLTAFRGLVKSADKGNSAVKGNTFLAFLFGSFTHCYSLFLNYFFTTHKASKFYVNGRGGVYAH
jgi:hypothetical protein